MLNKAKICSCDDHGKPEHTHHFYVQFNPNEISIKEPCAAMSYDAHDSPMEKQQEQEVLVFSTTLFFNTYTSASQKEFQDVRGFIRKFYLFTNYKDEKKTKLRKICFSWGTQCIVGILDQLDVKYTMFAPNGTPLRAEASISIKGGYYGEPPKGLAAKKEEALKKAASFMDALRDMKEPSRWKEAAKQQGVGKARSS